MIRAVAAWTAVAAAFVANPASAGVAEDRAGLISLQAEDLRLQSVPGNPAAQAEDVAYRLPFDDARPRVGQAPQGRFSHDDEENHVFDEVDRRAFEVVRVVVLRHEPSRIRLSSLESSHTIPA